MTERASESLVFGFDHRHEAKDPELTALLGAKGAGLAAMTRLGLPVPPGLTVAVPACREFLLTGQWPHGVREQVADRLAQVEALMNRRFGGDPALLLAVRSGAVASMPGMMDTVLNVGLTDEAKSRMGEEMGEHFVALLHHAFLRLYGRAVLDVGDKVDSTVDAIRRRTNRQKAEDLTLGALRNANEAILRLGHFPSDPYDQLWNAIEAVCESWHSDRCVAYRTRERIPDEPCVAVNVQAMVFGNRDGESCTGVANSRSPSTGEATPFGGFLMEAQGDVIVSGAQTARSLGELEDVLPDVNGEVIHYLRELEIHLRDICEVEFTVESGKLWLLQMRVAKRTGLAALKIAADLTDDPEIKLSRNEALLRITANHLDQVLHAQFPASRDYTVLVEGLPASPGAATGRAYFSADDAIEAAGRGEDVILLRPETSPADVRGMAVANGIVTSRGGPVSHAAVVARSWGKPAVVGADSMVIREDSCVCSNYTVYPGEPLTINGTTGEVALGSVPLLEPERPDSFWRLLQWADDVRARYGGLPVRANVDNAAGAVLAKEFGAVGIGLCRTEQMQRTRDALRLLSDSRVKNETFLRVFHNAQRDDVLELLAAAPDWPVTFRLLDTTLGGPSLAADAEVATSYGNSASAVAREAVPSLGARGVRLGVVWEDLYRAQLSGIFEAAGMALRDFGAAEIELMVPLAVTVREFRVVNEWMVSELEAARQRWASLNRWLPRLGVLIETPRAVLRAGHFAAECDFLSLGTNDLTQMTFAFSSDDVRGSVMQAYFDRRLLLRNPFETLDRRGVGQFLRMVIDAARDGRPHFVVSATGEHAGDPESIAFFHELEVSFLSVSPYRLPVARLAAAQCALRASGGGGVASAVVDLDRAAHGHP